MTEKPYRDYNSYLREIFGCRVQKISLDAGLTCPNRDGSLATGGCIYCNERGSGTGAAKRLETIKEQIQHGKSALGKRYKATKFLGYFQSFTNTYAPLPVLKRIFEEAISDPDIVGLTIGTRPDCVPDEVLDYLRKLSEDRLIWIEYGLQSANDATLLRIRRGHGVEAFVDAVRRTRARGIPICAHAILGLPGETLEDMLNTARFLSMHDIQGVKIHLLYVVRGTVLDKLYRDGGYRCLTREEYACAVGEFIALLPSHIIIQRITGDPHPDELIAPEWALEKQRNIEAINEYMRSLDLWQGKNWTS